jgi:hypothetical protein
MRSQKSLWLPKTQEFQSHLKRGDDSKEPISCVYAFLELKVPEPQMYSHLSSSSFLKGYSHLYLLRRDPLPSREIGLEPQRCSEAREERGKKQFGFLAKENNRGKLVCRGLEFQISFQNNKELILSTEQ